MALPLYQSQNSPKAQVQIRSQARFSANRHGKRHGAAPSGALSGNKDMKEEFTPRGPVINHLWNLSFDAGRAIPTAFGCLRR
ncbi:hypothetical protein J6590_048308 [Homalodisca vitripennis]|nr:hypothetical protein J6590_048308 [Homalodisca vitripennis]